MKYLLATFVVVIALSAPGMATASPITFGFTGVVSQDPFFDPEDPFGGTIAFGTTFSGSYTFDSAAPDGDGSANGGSYTSASGTLSLLIGGNTFIAADLVNIGVGDNFGSNDFYTVFAQNTSGTDPFDLSLTLLDFDGLALTSALLPTDAPPFAAFDVATLFLTGSFGGNQVQIDGQLSSLTCLEGCVPTVPEPSILALAGIGLAALGRRRHSRGSVTPSDRARP